MRRRPREAAWSVTAVVEKAVLVVAESDDVVLVAPRLRQLAVTCRADLPDHVAEIGVAGCVVDLVDAPGVTGRDDQVLVGVLRDRVAVEIVPGGAGTGI